MGAADFNTTITLKGAREDVLAMMRVVKSYITDKHEQYREKRNCEYLMGANIEAHDINPFSGPNVGDMSDDEMLAMIDKYNCQITISASGPYGVFGNLDDIDLFKDMAESAPHASFTGFIGGFSVGGDQCAAFELKDGLLHCSYRFGEEFEEDYDEDEDLDDEDWDDECEYEEVEIEWDFEVVYDPINKKIIES